MHEKSAPTWLGINVSFLLHQAGKAIIADTHQSSDEVKRILDNLNSQWEDLASKAGDKGDKLRQAAEQQMLNRALDDAQVCMLKHSSVLYSY